MRRFYSSMLSSLFVLAATVAIIPGLQAAETKDAVPDSASVVVRWKAPQATLGRIADFVDAVRPGFGNVVKFALVGMGQGIGNPGLQGVDADKDIWAIGFAESQREPAVAFVVTATDVDALKKNLLPNFTAFASGNIVAYSDNDDALKKVRERLESKGTALWPKIDAASVKLFDTTDLSVIVNVKQLVQAYSEEIKQAEPKIDELIDRIKDAIPNGQQQQMAMAFDVYRKLGKSGVEVIRDTNSWTFGITFSKNTISYQDRLQVASGTSTAKFLASQPASDLLLLNRLPVGKAVYTSAKLESSGLIEWAMSLTRSMLTDASADTLKQYDASVKEMSQLKFGELAMYLDVASELPAYRAAGVTMVAHADRLREISRSLVKVMGEVKLPNMTQTQKVDLNFAKIGTDSVDRITIKQEFDADADPTGVGRKMQSLMFGENGMQQLVMYRADRTFTSLGSMDDLKQLVAGMDSSSPSNAPVTSARKRLPAKSNLVVLVDLAQIATNSLKIAAQQGVLPINSKGLDSLTLEQSFLGYTLTCEPTSLQSQVDIPVELAQNVSKIIMALFQPQ